MRQIVDGAFETWARSAFYHTRLDDVAGRLRMTKPALYRYFRSKEELLAAMEKLFVSEYSEMGRRFEAGAATVSPHEAVALFVRERVRFFGRHVPYFYYMLHHIGTRHGGSVLRVMAGHMAFLGSCLSRLPGIRDPATAASYLRTTFSFFLMRAGLKKEVLRPRRLSDREQNELESLVQGICARGYATAGRQAPGPRMEEIERACSVSSTDIPREDAILRAVAETVAEHGFAEASIERIARRAGPTKSSLYFHFRDRDDMFSHLLARHQERLHELFEARSTPCRSASERLYCFLVVLGSYFQNAREMPAVMNWFRYHGYQLRVSHPDDATMARWFAFVSAALREGSLTSHGISLSHMAGHLSFVVVNHMMMAERTGQGARITDLRQIYDLFVHGTQGAKS